MRMRRVLVAVLAIALTGGVGACTSGRNGSAKPSAPAGPSAWDLTLRRVGPDGRVDLATALSAFALAIGPVPGGVPVPGPAAAIPSGTLALRWVLGHWNELSAEQRAAVLADLGASAATTAPAGLVLRAPRAPSPNPSLACPRTRPARSRTGPRWRTSRPNWRHISAGRSRSRSRWSCRSTRATWKAHR